MNTAYEDYKVYLAARNEGVEYWERAGGSDQYMIYRFNVGHSHGAWVVTLPPSKGGSFAPHPMTDDERMRILPRIEKFLSRASWLRFLGWRRAVKFVDGPAWTNYYYGQPTR